MDAARRMGTQEGLPEPSATIRAIEDRLVAGEIGVKEALAAIHGLAYMPNMGIVMPEMGMKKAKSRAPRAPRPKGLVDALFSTTQQRVLGLLFGQPDRSFYATELIMLTGSGSGAVQRELAKLEQSGLVATRRHGTQKHFQANPESPLFEELCSIARKTVGLRCRNPPCLLRRDGYREGVSASISRRRGVSL